MVLEVDIFICGLCRTPNTVGHHCNFDFVLGISLIKDDDWVIPSPLALFHILLHQLMIAFFAKDAYLIEAFRFKVLKPGPIDVSFPNVFFIYKTCLFTCGSCQHQSSDRVNDEETEIIMHKIGDSFGDPGHLYQQLGTCRERF